MKVRIEIDSDHDYQISVEELKEFTNAVSEAVDSSQHPHAYVTVSVTGLLYEKG